MNMLRYSSTVQVVFFIFKMLSCLDTQKAPPCSPQGEVDLSDIVASDPGLEVCDELVDLVISDLFHETENASPEKDLGVPILELFQGHGDLQKRECYVGTLYNQQLNVATLHSYWDQCHLYREAI